MQLRTAIYQFDAELGAVETNLARIEKILSGLPARAYDVIVFPEMCDTGYDMEVVREKAVLRKPGYLDGLLGLAKEKSLNILLGLSEREAERIYNSVVVIASDGTLAYNYRKSHLVTIAPICEHRTITPGNRLGLFTLGGLRVGVMTCYELRFPEIARTLTLAGIRMLFVPAAWPLARLDHLLTLVRARAIENQVYVLLSSRSGTDAGTKFSGHSLIVDPNGEILAEGPESGETLLRATIDLAEIGRSRGRIRALSERREDLYG